MDATVRSLINRGVAKSTLTFYATGKRRYLSFCTQFQCRPLPVEESTLLRFVAFLSSASLSYASVRSYLCAVRHLQIMSNLPDPAMATFPLLNYALRGLRRDGPRERAHPRLPITPEILRGVHRVWSRGPQDYNHTMLWAAFCLGFFAFSCLSFIGCVFSVHSYTFEDICT